MKKLLRPPFIAALSGILIAIVGLLGLNGMLNIHTLPSIVEQVFNFTLLILFAGGYGLSFLIDNIIYDTFSGHVLNLFLVLGNGFIYYLLAVLAIKTREANTIKEKLLPIFLIIGLLIFILFGLLVMFS